MKKLSLTFCKKIKINNSLSITYTQMLIDNLISLESLNLAANTKISIIPVEIGNFAMIVAIFLVDF